MHILALYRRLIVLDAATRLTEWHPMTYKDCSYEIKGKTLGIVGAGRIGRAPVDAVFAVIHAIVRQQHFEQTQAAPVSGPCMADPGACSRADAPHVHPCMPAAGARHVILGPFPKHRQLLENPAFHMLSPSCFLPTAKELMFNYTGSRTQVQHYSSCHENLTGTPCYYSHRHPKRHILYSHNVIICLNGVSMS